MKILKSCDLCGNKEIKVLFLNKDRINPVDIDYRVNQCRKCGLIFVNPQPNYQELSKHYCDYYSLKRKMPRRIKFRLYHLFYSKNPLKFLLWPLRNLIRTTKIKKNSKFLDVGCGSGEFLILMKSFGMDCYGVEPGDFDKEFAKEQGLKIFHGQIREAGYKSNFFDAVTLNYVFEHVYNPAKTLEEIYRITKPGGEVVIAVPQSNALMYKLFGKNWSGLDTPRHLFIFSKKTLIQYAKKTGFKVKRINYVLGSASILSTLLYATSKKYLSEKTFVQNNILHWLVFPFGFILKLFRKTDVIEIELEKP